MLLHLPLSLRDLRRAEVSARTLRLPTRKETVTYLKHQKVAWLLDTLIRATPAKDPERVNLLRKARHHHALMAVDPCNRAYRPSEPTADLRRSRR